MRLHPEMLSYIPAPKGARLSLDLPEWVRMAIAQGVIALGRAEQEIIEISEILKDSGSSRTLKATQVPSFDDFVSILEHIEQQKKGLRLKLLKFTFRKLVNERDLMVHGAWIVANGRPWVIWKSVIDHNHTYGGHYFDRSRFDRFLRQSDRILVKLREIRERLAHYT